MKLANSYWADNMTQPVLFAKALTTALNAGAYDLALEVGAHPALKGPATSTIQDVVGKDMPYFGILSRGMNSLETSAIGLGYLWAHLGKPSIDLNAYECALSGEDKSYAVIKGPRQGYSTYGESPRYSPTS